MQAGHRMALTSLPERALETVMRSLPAEDRLLLATSSKKLRMLANSLANSLWSDVCVQLYTPDKILLFNKWLEASAARVRSLRLEFFGGGCSDDGGDDDSCFVAPITMLLFTVCRSAVSLTSLEVVVDAGMMMAPISLSARDLQLPVLQRLELSGGVAIDADLPHLGALTELRLDCGPATDRRRPSLPPALHTLVLPFEYGLPPVLAKATQLRALSIELPQHDEATAGAVLRRLTSLTALRLGGRLANSQHTSLQALTGLERLEFKASAPSALRAALTLKRLTMLVFTCRKLAAVPGDLTRLPLLRVLVLGAAQLAGFAGNPAQLCFEDLLLDLDDAARLAPGLAALPFLHTLRLEHHGGGWLDQETASSLAVVLGAAGGMPSLRCVVLDGALSRTVGKYDELGAQVERLERERGIRVRRLQLFSRESVRPAVV